MAYEKNKWAIYDEHLPEDVQEDAFISKEKLDHIEDGIAEAHGLPFYSYPDSPSCYGTLMPNPFQS